MPNNLLKIYNERLDLLYTTDRQNIASVRAVFNRDFQSILYLRFKQVVVKPTLADGENTMDRLFRHLTTVIVDEKTRKREFETERSIRLHWIKYHLEEKKHTNVIVFSVADEKRIYVLDKDERYIIVFEPLRDRTGLFLLTAYYLEASRYKSIMKKYEKRGKDGVIWI